MAWCYGEFSLEGYRWHGVALLPEGMAPPPGGFTMWALAVRRWVKEKVLRRAHPSVSTTEELSEAFGSYRVRCRLCGTEMLYFVRCIYGFEGTSSYRPIALYLLCPHCGYLIEIDSWDL